MTNRLLSTIFITLLITATQAHYGDEYQCGHAEDRDLQMLDIEEDTSAFSEEGRKLAGTTYPNLRIYPHWDFLKASAPTAFYNYIVNDLAGPVIAYFQGALRVKSPVVGKLKLASSVSTICSKTTPAALKAGVDGDFVMIFDSYSEDSNVVASSKYCYLASGTKRPLIGQTTFNTDTFMIANGDMLLHEKSIYILMHEMMHIFGISNNVYKYYIDANGKTRTGHIKEVTIAGKERTVIDVPPLTEKLRNFYGCTTVPGAVMENDGGSGTANSHFERKFFVYEAMSSGGIYGRRVSEFSLALLEGSGWYAPDYSYAEPYFYGQGQGCNFVNDACSATKASFDEFCVGTARGCAPHGRGGGKCSSDSIADGCKYYDPDVEYDCENVDGVDYARLPSLQVFGRGAGSKCFTGSLNTKSSTSATTFCFKYTCSGSGSSTQVQVQIGKTTATCTKAGALTVSGYYGSINCPDPLEFCNTVGKKYCPRNCFGRGACTDGVCKCNTGFTGVDCGQLV